VPITDLTLHGLVRYEPTLGLIRELGRGSVLEVGSANVGVRGYGLTEPNWKLTVLDRSFDNYGSAGEPPAGCSWVLGDAREMPFDDRAFDVVVALDLLEHVPPADRARVLAELGRVAGRRVIVGCPAGGPALAADRRLPALYRGFGHPVPGWLDEHFEFGFPEPGELRDGLAPFGRVRLLGNESVRAHLLVMRLHVALHWLPPFQAFVRALSAGLRPGGAGRGVSARLLRLLRGRDRPPTYRTLAVLDVDRG
jgi:SAM-dependent methyltransferase